MTVDSLKDCEGKEIKPGKMIAFYQGEDDDRDFDNARLTAGIVYEMWDHPIFGQRMNVRTVDAEGNPTGYETVTPDCAVVLTPDNGYFAGFILRRAARVNISDDATETIPNAD